MQQITQTVHLTHIRIQGLFSSESFGRPMAALRLLHLGLNNAYAQFVIA